jgi:hypothetical protein
MKRRSLLKGTGALAAAALAGCLGNGGGAGTDDPTDTSPEETTQDDEPTEAPTETPTEDPTTTPPAVSVGDTSIETLSTGCGGGDSAGTAELVADGPRVEFSGALVTSDPCHEATVEEAKYDSDSGALTVVLGAEPTEEVCTDCVGAVEFEGAVALEGGLPDRAVLEYDGSVIGGSGTGDDEPVAHTGSEFEVAGSGRGGRSGEADIEFDPESGRVLVEGTITGRNGCMTAKLSGASYDAGSDTFKVDVVTVAREGTEDKACTQATIGIGYEGTFSFEGGLPGTVSVSHDGDGVVTAAHESTAATTTTE